jgi:putative holliday junction resolvase
MEKAIDKPNEAKTSHILGVDYGASKVGLSLADTETRIAFAYTTLKNDKGLLQSLAKIIKKESVGKIIIGVPAYVNRKEAIYAGEMFGELVKKALPDMEIEYQNEMFTTKMAQANLIEKQVKSVKKFDDQEAARIILQSWLDES